MLSVHLAFTNEQTRQGLSRVIRAAGLPLGEAHATGAGVIRAVRRRGGGLVLCGDKLADMTAQQVCEALSGEAQVVVLHREPGTAGLFDGGPLRLVMPPSPRELADQVRGLLQGEEARQRARRQARTPEEEDLIFRAKRRLMARLGVDENEAHRLLQQASMREGQRMAVTAAKVLQA